MTHPILVVDDDPANLAALRQILTPHHSLVFARNGTEALAAVAKHSPAMVLLDVEMPGMDGYEVCRVLKAQPQSHDIPVIFISARTSVGDETLGFELGAVDYINKPVSPPLVLARVKTHLSLVKAARLEAANQDLARSQAELEEFLRAAAHDLQEPCRLQTLFAQLLRREMGSGSVAIEDLETIVENAMKMQGMVESLRQYSVAGLANGATGVANFDEVVQTTWREVNSEGRGRLYPPLEPVGRVEADQSRLHLLMGHLLSNALRHGRDDAAVEVTILARRVDERVHIQVADNGIGISQALRQAILTPFTRACGQQRPGLGLAICRRVVRGLGDDINLDGNDQGGVTVSFSLPISAGRG